jgi:hypothetical protein
MRLAEIAVELALSDLMPDCEELKSVDITVGYCSDLLSDVLAHAPSGGVLITIQAHLNVIAVAVHASLAAVIFAAGRRPDQAVVRQAAEDGVQLYASDHDAFDLAGRLYELGVRGRNGDGRAERHLGGHGTPGTAHEHE